MLLLSLINISPLKLLSAPLTCAHHVILVPV